MQKISMIVLALVLMTTTTMAEICPSASDGKPLEIHEITDIELRTPEFLFMDEEGIPQKINNYLYNHFTGRLIDLEEVETITLLSYHFSPLCDVSVEMSAVVISNRDDGSFRIAERKLGGGSYWKVIATLYSVTNLPIYDGDKSVRVINEHLLPEEDNVIISANDTKYGVEMTEFTLTIIKERDNVDLSHTLFYTNTGLGAPSLQPKVRLKEIPQEIKELFRVSPKGKKMTTWGALKSRR